jgi:hypothetical protein
MIEVTLRLHPDDSEMVELRGTTNSGAPIVWGLVHTDILNDPSGDSMELIARLKSGYACDVELNIL